MFIFRKFLSMLYKAQKLAAALQRLSAHRYRTVLQVGSGMECWNPWSSWNIFVIVSRTESEIAAAIRMAGLKRDEVGQTKFALMKIRPNKQLAAHFNIAPGFPVHKGVTKGSCKWRPGQTWFTLTQLESLSPWARYVTLSRRAFETWAVSNSGPRQSPPLCFQLTT